MITQIMFFISGLYSLEHMRVLSDGVFALLPWRVACSNLHYRPDSILKGTHPGPVVYSPCRPPGNGTGRHTDLRAPVRTGPRSISDKTSYHKISWSLEAARLKVEIIASLWNLEGTSVAPLPRCLSNFKAIVQLWIQISRLRDLAISYNKTSYRILKRDPVPSISSAADMARGAYPMPSHLSSVRRPSFIRPSTFISKSNRLPQFSFDLSDIWLACAQQYWKKICSIGILIFSFQLFNRFFIIKMDQNRDFWKFWPKFSV